MLNSRTDYVYTVPQLSVQIDGGILPNRTTDARVLRGEDVAFLAECTAARRQTLFGSPGPLAARLLSAYPRKQEADAILASLRICGQSGRWVKSDAVIADRRNQESGSTFASVYADALIPLGDFEAPESFGWPLVSDELLPAFADLRRMSRCISDQKLTHSAGVEHYINDGTETDTVSFAAGGGLKVLSGISSAALGFVWYESEDKGTGNTFTAYVTHRSPSYRHDGIHAFAPIESTSVVVARCITTIKADSQTQTFTDFVVVPTAGRNVLMPYTFFKSVAETHTVPDAKVWSRGVTATGFTFITQFNFKAGED